MTKIAITPLPGVFVVKLPTYTVSALEEVTRRGATEKAAKFGFHVSTITALMAMSFPHLTVFVQYDLYRLIASVLKEVVEEDGRCRRLSLHAQDFNALDFHTWLYGLDKMPSLLL